MPLFKKRDYKSGTDDAPKSPSSRRSTFAPLNIFSSANRSGQVERPTLIVNPDAISQGKVNEGSQLTQSTSSSRNLSLVDGTSSSPPSGGARVIYGGLSPSKTIVPTARRVSHNSLRPDRRPSSPSKIVSTAAAPKLRPLKPNLLRLRSSVLYDSDSSSTPPQSAKNKSALENHTNLASANANEEEETEDGGHGRLSGRPRPLSMPLLSTGWTQNNKHLAPLPLMRDRPKSMALPSPFNVPRLSIVSSPSSTPISRLGDNRITTEPSPADSTPSVVSPMARQYPPSPARFPDIMETANESRQNLTTAQNGAVDEPISPPMQSRPPNILPMEDLVKLQPSLYNRNDAQTIQTALPTPPLTSELNKPPGSGSSDGNTEIESMGQDARPEHRSEGYDLNNLRIPTLALATWQTLPFVDCYRLLFCSGSSVFSPGRENLLQPGSRALGLGSVIISDLSSLMASEFRSPIVFSAILRQFCNPQQVKARNVTGMRLIEDFTKLPFPDSYFDLIRSVTLWLNVRNPEYPRVMRELHRILKPG